MHDPKLQLLGGGTVGYYPPTERGRSEKSDVFALGVILMCLLTGSRNFLQHKDLMERVLANFMERPRQQDVVVIGATVGGGSSSSAAAAAAPAAAGTFGGGGGGSGGGRGGESAVGKTTGTTMPASLSSALEPTPRTPAAAVAAGNGGGGGGGATAAAAAAAAAAPATTRSGSPPGDWTPEFAGATLSRMLAWVRQQLGSNEFDPYFPLHDLSDGAAYLLSDMLRQHR
jgi:hypothetical protein